MSKKTTSDQSNLGAPGRHVRAGAYVRAGACVRSGACVQMRACVPAHLGACMRVCLCACAKADVSVCVHAHVHTDTRVSALFNSWEVCGHQVVVFRPCCSHISKLALASLPYLSLIPQCSPQSPASKLLLFSLRGNPTTCQAPPTPQDSTWARTTPDPACSS